MIATGSTVIKLLCMIHVLFQSQDEEDFEMSLASRLRTRKRRLLRESEKSGDDVTVVPYEKLGEVVESEVDVVPCSQSEAESQVTSSQENNDDAENSSFSQLRTKPRRSRRLCALSTSSVASDTPLKKCR